MQIYLLKTYLIKNFKLFFLLFPFITIGQKRFDFIREKLKQDKKYEYVYRFENNYAVFRTFNKKMGVIDSIGNVVINPTYSYIYNNKKLKNLFEVAENSKKGYIDINSKIKIPIIFDDVFYVEKNLIRIKTKEKYGVLDTLNNIILPPKFKNISFDNNLIIAKTGEIKNLYNYKGKQLNNFQISEISKYTNNKAIATLQDNSNLIINNHGDIILKHIKGYSYERVLNNSLFLINNNLNSKKGILNSSGEFMVQCKYDEIIQTETFFIAEKNNKKGIISLTDSIIKPFIYDHIHSTSYDSTVSKKNYLVKKNGLFGVINPNKKNDIIPIKYKSNKTLFDHYYIVENTENKNGLFLKNGEKILNQEYKFYNVFEKTIFATKDNKQFLINLNGENYNETEILVDKFIKHKDIYGLPESDNQIFMLKSKFGVINNKRHIVIPCKYDFIENINLTKQFLVRKNNKFGIVDSENRIIVDIEYDEFKKVKSIIHFLDKNQKVTKSHEIFYK
jgi:hypothetical protein